MAFYCSVLCTLELLSRGVWTYLTCPWVWARLVDPRIKESVKRSLIAQLLKIRSRECCGDRGFTIRFLSALGENLDPSDLLPGGRWFSTVEMVSAHRVINVKIEDNFARASAQKSHRGAVCYKFASRGWSSIIGFPNTL